jgi:hypothetical protein
MERNLIDEYGRLGDIGTKIVDRDERNIFKAR